MTARPTARPKGTAELAEMLASTLRGSLLPGSTWTGHLGHDDVVLEVSVVVRRRVAATDAQRWLADALAHFRLAPTRVLRCECRVNRDVKGWKGGGQCKSKGTAVLVLAGWREGSAPTFTTICGRHREGHGYRLAGVLATLDLPVYELERLRRLGERWESHDEVEGTVLGHRERRIGPRDSYETTYEPAPSCGEESVGAVVERMAAAADVADLPKLRDALPAFLPGWYVVDTNGRRRVA